MKNVMALKKEDELSTSRSEMKCAVELIEAHTQCR